MSGPLYNNLNWGGFLMWYMPDYPVAIDGRNDLYGDEMDRLFFNSQNADTSYTTDPYLNEAGVVLLDSQLPLAKVLSVDPRSSSSTTMTPRRYTHGANSLRHPSK